MSCANDGPRRSASVSAWWISIGGGPSTTYSLITNVRMSSKVSRSASANASLTLLAISRRSGRDGMGVLLESRAIEVGARGLAADEACAGQIGAAQVHALEVAAHERRVAQGRAVEVGATEVDVEQHGAGPVGARQRNGGVLVT